MNINRIDSRTRAKYRQLDEARRREVDALFHRHSEACAKIGLGPDPLFLFELMGEINADRVDFAQEAFGLDCS